MSSSGETWETSSGTDPTRQAETPRQHVSAHQFDPARQVDITRQHSSAHRSEAASLHHTASTSSRAANANTTRQGEMTRQHSSAHHPESASHRHSAGTSSRAANVNTQYPPSASHRLVQSRDPRRRMSSGSHNAPEKPLPVLRSATYNDRHQQGNMPHAVSKTIDRLNSVADFSKLSRDSPEEVLETLAASRLKILEGKTGFLAELEMRLGIRSLALAQANIRMENLRLDIGEGKFKNAADLNVALTQEEFHCLSRMEQMCLELRRCHNDPPLCQHEYSVLANQSAITDYKVQDSIAGYPIQDYLDQCEQDHKQAPHKTMHAAYHGLAVFFRTFIGPYDPNKPRCRSRKGFLEAWRGVVNMPTYLDGLNQELGKMQTSSAIARKDCVHDGKPSKVKRLSNLFTSRPSSRGSDTSS